MLGFEELLVQLTQLKGNQCYGPQTTFAPWLWGQPQMASPL